MFGRDRNKEEHMPAYREAINNINRATDREIEESLRGASPIPPTPKPVKPASETTVGSLAVAMTKTLRNYVGSIGKLESEKAAIEEQLRQLYKAAHTTNHALDVIAGDEALTDEERESARTARADYEMQINQFSPKD